MAEKKSLVSKLAEVMKEIGHVPKRGFNDFHKYKYVMEADLCDAIREKLAARSVVMIPSVTSATREKVILTNKRGETADMLVSDVMVEYTLMDGESEERIKFSMPGSAMDSGDKGIYKAITGSDKYALMKAFLVPTGDDPEADGEVDAKAAGFKVASEPERKKLVEDKIDELKQKIDARKVESSALKKTQAIIESALGEPSEFIVEDILTEISKEKKSSTGNAFVNVTIGGHKVFVYDKPLFQVSESNPEPALVGFFNKKVRAIVEKNKQGYKRLVSIEPADIQIRDADLPF